MSAIGDKAVELAGKIADGYICTAPSRRAVWRSLHKAGGEGKPSQGGAERSVHAADEATGRRTAHRIWPTQGIKGEASQLLPLPRHFEELAEMVTEDEIATPCGPDPEVHVKAIKEYVDAGFDEVYISQIGQEQDAFFRLLRQEVLPRLR
ncbi:hypothetical protein GCM10018952_27650 [Streptosporangium vulgare]